MTLKESLEAAQARITELEPKVAILEGEKTDLTNQVTEANGKISGFEAEKTELNGQIATHIETISKLVAEKAQLSGKVATLELDAKSADERAREIAARNGGNLAPKAQGAGNSLVESGSAKVMDRDDFEALPAKDQRAFCAAGGKLTD